MSRLEQLEAIEREVRARLLDEKPKAVYTACNLSGATVCNVLSGKRVSLATLRALARYFDDKDGER
ncbi:hypothetical protein Pan97_30110 [Bremerella volcania]|uniref:HTH cro/C1-type domain-containing protein n=1 Tax=Bremerella volcania TaxID=2527984 RepID=A0A518C9Q6_9BACT|nr:hypothetical protein [Bremerella volcania]QDU75967.1 hypothetical protein Pan97_30110 [Bremerella volcania]